MPAASAYESFGFAVMRTPLLPMYEMQGNKINLFISDADTYESLLQKINTSVFEEALLISSPDLYNELLKIKTEGVTEENKNALRKILCYFFRMSVRPTPFGISAGVSVVHSASTTSIQLDAMTMHRKKVNINFDFINKLYASLRAGSGFLKKQSYFANSTLYKNFKGFHFIKTDRTPYLKSSIPYSAVIENILSFAKEAVSYASLMKYMTGELLYPHDMSETFLEKLIQMELLLPSIYPSLFANNNRDSFINILKSSEVKNNLWELADDIEQYEKAALGNGIEYLSRINQCMEAELKSDSIHVVSAFSLSKKLINSSIEGEINKSLIFLCRLRGLKGCTELKRFAEEFAFRYGDKQVPLCEAIDEHTGIGYPVLKKPFINSTLTEHLRQLDLEEITLNKTWDSFLLQLLNSFYEHKEATEIVLTDHDLRRINSGLDDKDLTESIYTTFSLLAKSNEEIDNGNYLIDFMFGGGPSCVNPFNRFSHLTPELDEKIQACSVWENEYHKKQELHCAEINFIPRQGIGGNILTRGNFRENEIPIGTAPTPGKNVFSINDIYLYHKDGRLFAVDNKSKKKILPVATVMYDNHNTASINYNSFLTDFGHQEKLYNLSWSWGSLATVIHHFPRVRYGKCILSKEMWRITIAEVGVQSGDIKKELKSLIRKKGIPAWVNYIEKTDNLLFLNLKNDVCLDILESKLTKYGQVLLCENLHTRETTFVKSEAGLHTNEFILPMRLGDSFINRDQLIVPADNEKSRDGNQYTHIKIGCNHYLMDEIIQLTITRFCSTASGNKLIHFYRADSPAGIGFLMQENGEPKITITDMEALFSSYKEPGHVYHIALSQSGMPYTDKMIPESLLHENTTMIAELIKQLKARRELPMADLRFLTLLIISVHYAKKLFSSVNEGQELMNQLLEEKKRTLSVRAVTVQKKSLAPGYRKIIELLQAHYNPLVTAIKEIVHLFLSEEVRFSAIQDKQQAFYNLINLSGNKLLYTSLTISEWITLLDFTKQYLHNEANLVKYKGISL